LTNENQYNRSCQRQRIPHEGLVMTDIYLAVSTDEIEGYSVIAVYTEKEEVDTFIAECKEYEATKEPYPVNDADEFFDLWLERKQDWLEKHPAGTHGDCDGYDVYTAPLRS